LDPRFGNARFDNAAGDNAASAVGAAAAGAVVVGTAVKEKTPLGGWSGDTSETTFDFKSGTKALAASGRGCGVGIAVMEKALVD
jgi:hypothetical protein